MECKVKGCRHEAKFDRFNMQLCGLHFVRICGNKAITRQEYQKLWQKEWATKNRYYVRAISSLRSLAKRYNRKISLENFPQDLIKCCIMLQKAKGVIKDEHNSYQK